MEEHKDLTMVFISVHKIHNVDKNRTNRSPKAKTDKYASLFLHQCTFTVHRPRVHIKVHGGVSA